MSKRFGLRTITGRLLLAFLAVFLPLAASQYVTYWKSTERERLIARQAEMAVAKAAAAVVQDMCEDIIQELHIASASFAMDRGDSHLNDTLEALSSHGKECIAAGFVDLSTNTLTSYPPLKLDQKTIPLPSPELRTGPSVTAVGRLGSNQVFTVSTPVAANGDKPALLYAVITTGSLKRALSRALGQPYSVAVIDQNGREVCCLSDAQIPCSVSALASVKVPAAGTTFEFAAENGSSGSMAVVPLSGWRVAVFTNYGRPLEPPGAAPWVATSFVLMAALVLFMIIGRRIAHPIRKLSRAAAAVAVGDFRRRVEIHSGDELQSLASSFNQMAVSLEEHERELRMKTRLQQSLLEVTRTVTGSLDLGRVASSITDVLKHQFGAAEAVIFRMDETTGRIERVAPDGSKTQQVPEQMLRLAEHVFDFAGPLSLPAAVAYPEDEIGGGTVTAMPLVVGNRPVGVLTATFLVEEEWDPELRDRMELLQSFASVAAVAIHNAEIHGRTEEFMRMLDSLRRVVDSISSSLDLNQVLHSLVKTTCEVMGAKACALLLAGKDGTLSVAEAHNLSRQFRNRLSVEPGERWTGIAYSEKRPVTRMDVAAEKDLRLGIYAGKEGLHGYMSAPLIVGSEAIGTINVWMDHPHEATSMEVNLLTWIAGHAAVVIANAKLFGREYHIAETLQSTLIGVIPPRMGRLVFGHKYLPVLDEAQVGGDLYDVVDLPNGKVALVVADVSGKGIQAAVYTATIRYMARAFLYEWPDSPAHALTWLNKAFHSQSGGTVFVTVFCAVIDPETGSMVYANAGHPPAIAVTSSGKQQMLFYRTGMPVGYAEDSEYYERSLRLGAGDMLLLYTDGIIEAQQDKQVLTIEGLQDILFAYPELGPADLVEAVCRETSRYANENLRDDIAIVAAALDA